MPPQVNTSKHLRIYGRVQGVYFRESMRIKAESIHVTGWVRNLPDGSVEAVVQGSEENIADIIVWAHRGPDMARVERVEENQAEPVVYKRFEVIR